MQNTPFNMSQHSQPQTTYLPPSITAHLPAIHAGTSYTHYSALPTNITPNTPAALGTPCTLGIDEAGRGPVIGPMIYGTFYLPSTLHHPLLSETHHFNDSKVLTPAFRSQLMSRLCDPASDLFASCGWAIKSLSARDISAGMLRAGGSYNLNAQAVDATVEIIRGVLAMDVNVTEVFVDTIGQPVPYQRRLQALFPGLKVVVEKKADSLFPVVSAASVVAKVSRDAACEELYRGWVEGKMEEEKDEDVVFVDKGQGADEGWGSGYPSDARCVGWMKGNMNGLFGWGGECRFSWGTVKDLLEGGGKGVVKVDWPDDDDENGNLSQYFNGGGLSGVKGEVEELRAWYGGGVKEIF